MTTQDLNPLSYMGVKDSNPPNVRFFNKNPTTFDIYSFSIGDFWINTVTQTSWQLMSKAGGVAGWVAIGGPIAQVSELTPDVGAVVTPIAGSITLAGGNGIQTSNGGTNTLVISGIDATTATKGVSQFSSTEFTVTAGAVELKGGLVLLGSQNPVNATDAHFLVPVTWRDLLLVISDAKSVNDADVLRMQMSNDSGATWIAAGYESGVTINDYDSAVTANANSATEFVLSGGLDTGAAASSYSGSIYIYGANIPNVPRINGSATYFRDSSSKTAFCQIFGTGGATGLNAISIYFNTGNIASGRFSLYGIKES